MDQMKKAQAELGAELYTEDVTEVDLSQRPLLSALRSARLELTALYCHWRSKTVRSTR